MDNETMLHPREVAKMFGVHLRTVFRWVKRGLISSRRGRLDADVVRRVYELWEQTIPQEVAKRELRVSQGTLSNWRKKGFLVYERILTYERITNSSVEEMLKVKARGRVFSRPGYERVCTLLHAVGFEHKALANCIRRGDVRTELVDGVRMVPVEEYDSIVSQMESSLDHQRSARFWV